MSGFKALALAAVAGALWMASPVKAAAELSLEIGVAPDCPYGYYDYAPYSCVPDGTMVRSVFGRGAVVSRGGQVPGKCRQLV